METRNNNVLKMNNINKSFEGVKVLHDIDLDLKKGEILGLVGKNGAGKSTLVKILYGVEKKDSGNIEILGKSLDHKENSNLQKQNIAMIFQDLSLLPNLNVSDNIYLQNLPSNKIHLLDTKKCREKANTLLEMMEVKIKPNDLVENLSVTDKQSVEIAKALSQNKKILIMDEPTSSLSLEQVKSLFNIIKKLKQQDISIIYISHNLREVLEICDRVTILKDGRNVRTSKIANTNIEEIVYSMTGFKTAEGVANKNQNYLKKELAKTNPILEVKNLSFGNVNNNASFNLYPGEILGIGGLAGSGRTELLETLYGAQAILKGEIYINGVKISKNSPDKAAKLSLMLIPDERQTKGLVMTSSVIDNIILSILEKLRYLGIFLNSRKSIETTKKLVNKLNIVISNFNQSVSTLSGGNQQKVVLSKAIGRDSKILLLDDPTVGIDVESKREISEIIIDYVASKEKAAILVSSEMDILANLCNRILIMKKGKIVTEIINEETNPVTEEKLLALIS